MFLPVSLRCDERIVETQGLLDSGAGGTFIDQNFARTLGLEWKKLEKNLVAYNVDATANKKGLITHSMEIPYKIGNRQRKQIFLITGLGKQKIIFGFDWLKSNNPIIDWQKGEIEWRKTTMEELINIPIRTHDWIPADWTIISEERINQIKLYAIQLFTNRSKLTIPDQKEGNDEIHLRAYLTETKPCFNSEYQVELVERGTAGDVIEIRRFSHAIEFAKKFTEEQKETTLEEKVPVEYHEFLSVFSDTEAARFPEQKPWDHKIDLKPGFVPKSSKVYSLTPEQEKLAKEFIDENLKKGYI